MATLRVWNSLNNTAEEALELAEGYYVADFGGLPVQQSVDADHTLEAAQALIDAGIELKATTQAKIIVTAQQQRVAFTDWVSELTM